MMTLLIHWIATPAARALGWTLFHSLWEGIAIAAVLAIALLFLRAAPLRYAAACLALAAILAASVATFFVVLPDQQRRPGPAQLRLVPTPPDTGGAPANNSRRFHLDDLLPWAPPLWLAGVLLLHLRTMAGWIGVRRLRRSGVCRAPREWQERLSALAATVRLSTPVALLESCRVDVPLVIGYLRPVILLPLGLLAGMPPDALEAILLHELAHIRRRDYLVNLLQTVAENLLFYHPAVWWISRLIRAEREHCCDDLVVSLRGDPGPYAAALTALETRRWSSDPALAATGGNLVKRVHRLLDRPTPPHAALTPAFSAALVIATFVALAAWHPKAAAAPPAPSPQAAMSPYDKWVNEDVAYIIDDRERTAFLQLATDAEREHFIEQFWLRRDPTPATPENEFKIEHYRRIAYANDHFTTPSGKAGWRTDRGRIYIIYGPPDELEKHPDAFGRPYPVEAWRYRHLDGVGDDIRVEFTDPTRTGDFRMMLDPSISLNSIWPDTVRRGDMRRQVRGLGVLTDSGSAEVRLAVQQAGDVTLGLPASVDLRSQIATGRVARFDPQVVNGTVTVMIQLDAPLVAVQPGTKLDATIDIETIRDTLMVGRTVSAKPNSDDVIFKIEPDGRHAVPVRVRYGRTSVNQIEIVSGLAPGDRVILSDMSGFARFDRIELR